MPAAWSWLTAVIIGGSVCVSRPPKVLADIVAMTTYELASSKNSGTLTVRASIARRPGNGEQMIERT